MENIIFTGLQHWNIKIGSNAKDIAAEMSRSYKVLYVNKPQPLVGIDTSCKRGALGIEKINDNLYTLELSMRTLPLGRIRIGWIFDIVNYINNWRMARQIRKACRQLGFSDYLHIIDNDIYQSFYMKEMLDAKKTIYYRRDRLYLNPFWESNAERLEPKLIAKSDLVLTNSPYLAETVTEYNENTYCVGQGADLSLYNPKINYAKPAELSSLQGAIVGYVGAIISIRLDADLIYEVAKQMPDINFVMVGPRDEVFTKHKLNELENVLFIPPVPPQNTPQYIAHFDICMNPQLLNEVTIGNYPRKIDEYLAMGKPTIATNTPTMRMFDDCVSLCSGSQEFIDAIRKLLSKGNTPEEQEHRIAVANSHSWESCVKLMCEKIEEQD